MRRLEDASSKHGHISSILLAALSTNLYPQSANGMCQKHRIWGLQLLTQPDYRPTCACRSAALMYARIDCNRESKDLNATTQSQVMAIRNCPLEAIAFVLVACTASRTPCMTCYVMPIVGHSSQCFKSPSARQFLILLLIRISRLFRCIRQRSLELILLKTHKTSYSIKKSNNSQRWVTLLRKY